MNALELLDYRRIVARSYAHLRQDDVPARERFAAFRAAKDELFRDHPASPLDAAQRRDFRGLPYHPHDRAWRVRADFEEEREASVREVDLGDDGLLRMRRVGWATFTLDGAACRLAVFWLAGYGGGLFLPFRDATTGRGTYGGGRYLLDTVKHADLGSEEGRLVLDFNAAYNPSCAYHPRWACPLAPPENTLDMAVTAGEKDPAGHVPGSDVP